jgi:predicted metal-dependent hydrolase
LKTESTEHRLHYGEEVIPYTVRRSPGRRRRVAIHVEADGRVLVDAPEGAAPAEIEAAVAARARWIHGHLTAARKRLEHVLPREYVSGESVWYLGRRYRLKVFADGGGAANVRLRGSLLEARVSGHDPTLVRAALEGWYRERARAFFQERLAALASALPWLEIPPPVRLQAMRVQWGSCSPAGRLTLNPHLVKAPRECVDYVLLHELCHLKEHNHSRRFFRMLDAHMPGWREVKAKLDDLAEMLLNV